MLEGKTVNLRIMEKEDLGLYSEWVNNPEVLGKYEPISEMSKTEIERQYESLKDAQWFLVEKKDGTKIGYIAHFLVAGEEEVGYFILPNERRKG